MSRRAPGVRSRSPWRVALVAAGLVLSCTSGADLDQLYRRGVEAARDDRWKEAMPDLEAFTAKACAPPRPDQRCREAYLGLGRGHERGGQPARAWVAFDAALALPPHARDAKVQESLTRAEQELRDRQPEGSARGPVLVRYRDEVTDEYTPRSVIVSLDFSAVYTRDKDAAELRSPDFTQVFGGSVPAGPHVLLVETVHGCRPGQGVRCAGSHVHQSWAFDSQAHTPVTLEVRAFAETDTPDANRPALEMRIR